MATLESLTPSVHAMHGEVKQLMQDRTLLNQAVQRLEAGVAQLQAQQAQDVQAAAIHQLIRDSGDVLTAEVKAAVQRLVQLEQQAVGPSASGHSSKKKWGLTRPTDMEPEKFVGKDEGWLQWKEATEDYADAVHPGLKHAMGVAAKAGGPITDRSQPSGVPEDEWVLNSELFVLLKRKTTGEANTLVTSAERDTGLESWRILVSRFEPQVGIKRMKEICDLLSLQNKRCKNTAETGLILLDMGSEAEAHRRDRR